MANTPGDSFPWPDWRRIQSASFPGQQISPPASNAAFGAPPPSFHPLSQQSPSPWPPPHCSAPDDDDNNDDDDDIDGGDNDQAATPRLFFYAEHAPSPVWASPHSFAFAPRAGVFSLPPPPLIYSTPPAALTPASSTYFLPQADHYLLLPSPLAAHPLSRLPSALPPYPPGPAAPSPHLPITLDPAATAQREPDSDDYYLQLVADGTYSSPSSGLRLADRPYSHDLPSLAPARQHGDPIWADDGQTPTPLAGQSATTGAPDLVDLTAASASRGAGNDLAGSPDEPPTSPPLPPVETPTRSAPRPSNYNLTRTPTDDDSMPVTRKRGAAAVAAESSSSSSAPPRAKRRRTSATTTSAAAARSSRAAKPASSRSTPARATPAATSSGAAKQGRSGGFESDDDEDFEVIDLSNPEKVQPAEEPAEEEEQAPPKPDRSVKLSGYQCVICMDNVTALAVTYCGHMFCSECIHSSLNIDPTRKTCPVCRQKLEGPRNDGRPVSRTTKTYFHLELKLMPANRRGKRPANW